MFKFIAPVAAGIAILTAPTAAFAETKPFERVVHVDDLDLAKPEDQRQMEIRVQRAVKAMCVDRRTRDIDLRARQSACLKEAQSKTQTQMAQKIADARYGG